MSRNRLVVSALLAWHVAALGIGAVPLPGLDPLPAIPLSRHVADDPIAVVVSPILDSILELFASTPGVVLRTARPVRLLVDRYLRAISLPQRWSMFADPPRVDQYVKVRYYIGSGELGSAAPRVSWTATELVLPAHREDRVRGVQ